MDSFSSHVPVEGQTMSQSRVPSSQPSLNGAYTQSSGFPVQNTDGSNFNNLVNYGHLDLAAGHYAPVGQHVDLSWSSKPNGQDSHAAQFQPMYSYPQAQPERPASQVASTTVAPHQIFSNTPNPSANLNAFQVSNQIQNGNIQHKPATTGTWLKNARWVEVIETDGALYLDNNAQPTSETRVRIAPLPLKSSKKDAAHGKPSQKRALSPVSNGSSTNVVIVKPKKARVEKRPAPLAPTQSQFNDTQSYQNALLRYNVQKELFHPNGDKQETGNRLYEIIKDVTPVSMDKPSERLEEKRVLLKTLLDIFSGQVTEVTPQSSATTMATRLPTRQEREIGEDLGSLLGRSQLLLPRMLSLLKSFFKMGKGTPEVAMVLSVLIKFNLSTKQWESLKLDSLVGRIKDKSTDPEATAFAKSLMQYIARQRARDEAETDRKVTDNPAVRRNSAQVAPQAPKIEKRKVADEPINRPEKRLATDINSPVFEKPVAMVTSIKPTGSLRQVVENKPKPLGATATFADIKIKKKTSVSSAPLNVVPKVVPRPAGDSFKLANPNSKLPASSFKPPQPKDVTAASKPNGASTPKSTAPSKPKPMHKPLVVEETSFSTLFKELKEREAKEAENEILKRENGPEWEKREMERNKALKKPKKTVQWASEDKLIEVKIIEWVEPEDDYYGGTDGVGVGLRMNEDGFGARDLDMDEGHAWKRSHEAMVNEDDEVDWYEPTGIIFSDVLPEKSTSENGLKRGGTVAPESPDAEEQKRRESSVLLTMYSSYHDIPGTPSEPDADTLTSDTTAREPTMMSLPGHLQEKLGGPNRPPVAPTPQANLSSLLANFANPQPAAAPTPKPTAFEELLRPHIQPQPQAPTLPFLPPTAFTGFNPHATTAAPPVTSQAPSPDIQSLLSMLGAPPPPPPPPPPPSVPVMPFPFNFNNQIPFPDITNSNFSTGNSFIPPPAPSRADTVFSNADFALQDSNIHPDRLRLRESDIVEDGEDDNYERRSRDERAGRSRKSAPIAPPSNSNRSKKGKKKTVPCDFWQRGHCRRGNDCHFAHDGTPGQGKSSTRS